jgi:hypothetical protein
MKSHNVDLYALQIGNRMLGSYPSANEALKAASELPAGSAVRLVNVSKPPSQEVLTFEQYVEAILAKESV